MMKSVKSKQANPSWQQQLAQGFSDPIQLLKHLKIHHPLLPPALLAHRQFTTRVPLAFVQRMREGDLNDPLLKQVLPVHDEMLPTPGLKHDPYQELKHNPLPGLLHKYPGRVLLTLTGACAVNCRFCFRRHFPYQANNPGKQGWQQVVDYIAQDESIQEVILSGGDPLIAPDEHIASLVEALQNIKHLTTLRFHTRLPIVLPDRITPEFINILTGSSLQTVMIYHCNHANEIDHEVAAATDLFHQAKITCLNQHVLLRGINDDVETLKQLYQKCFSIGVLPYYCHQHDSTPGTAHFAVNDAKAKALHQQLQQQLPGYLVPKLVREIAGEQHKVLLR